MPRSRSAVRKAVINSQEERERVRKKMCFNNSLTPLAVELWCSQKSFCTLDLSNKMHTFKFIKKLQKKTSFFLLFSLSEGMWLCGSVLQCDHWLEHILLLPVIPVSSALGWMSHPEKWKPSQWVWCNYERKALQMHAISRYKADITLHCLRSIILINV